MDVLLFHISAAGRPTQGRNYPLLLLRSAAPFVLQQEPVDTRGYPVQNAHRASARYLSRGINGTRQMFVDMGVFKPNIEKKKLLC
jgi:hypothetical protein